MAGLSFPFAHLIICNVISIKVEAIKLVFIENLIGVDVLNNFHFKHLLTYLRRFVVIIFSLLLDPLQNFSAHGASLVHSEPARLVVLHVDFAAHNVCPVFQRLQLVASDVVV